MLIREDYLKKIRPFYDIDLIKVITGMRRSGKSVILLQIKNEIVAKYGNKNIIEINFEDLRFEKINTYLKLTSYIRKRISNSKEKFYIFLDEIQHVASFEKALSSLRIEFNCSIFVTGSNSKLLSGKLATLLVGRCIEFKVLPFSFKEAFEFYYNTQDNIDLSLQDFLRWGGLPLRFSLKGDDIKNYIIQVYQGIIEKDIVTPKSRINSHNFNLFASYILTNAGNELSIENISNFFKSKNKETLETKALYRYLDKLEKACFISRVKKYDINGKKKMAYFEKQYVTDTSLITINGNYNDIANGFVLENVIYNELIKRGYIVFIGKTKYSEIDFVVTNGAGKKCFIQVSYLLASQDTIKREFGAFDHIRDNAPKYVMSLDKFDLSQNGIAHINIIDFLLEKRNIELF